MLLPILAISEIAAGALLVTLMNLTFNLLVTSI
jgi:hypothetical protein